MRNELNEQEHPMHTFKKIILSLILFPLLIPQISSQNIIHVNKNANGANNGSNWTDAFTNLQDAITQADSSNMIWVAEGIYFPTNTNERSISFVLKNGVQMYGGFEGIENNLPERDFINHPTILSGDIGTTGDSTDNSYHVVYSIGTDSTARIDGFIIRDGYAVTDTSISNFNFGAGIELAINSSHPLTSPIIVNNQFINNHATQQGGAIHCMGNSTGMAAPHIQRCTFLNNSALWGGAIYKEGNSITAHPFVIDSCIFQENKAPYGGAISFWNIEGMHAVENCFFERDSGILMGGAILYQTYNSSSDLLINNCHFNQEVGALGVITFSLNNTSAPSIYNIKIKDCSLTGENLIFSNLHPAIFLWLTPNQDDNQVFFEIENTLFSGIRTTTGGGAFDIDAGNRKMIVHTNIKNCYFKGKNPIPPGTHFYYNAFEVSDISENDSIIINVDNTIFETSNLVLTTPLSNSNTPNYIQANFTNCTFYNNGKTLFHRKWDPTFLVDHHINVSNSIIWTDSPIDSLFYNHNINTDSLTFEGYNVHHCLINTPDCIVNGIDVCGPGMLYQLDPLFVDSMNGDFRLRACSPAINVGDNNSIDTSIVSYDYDGQLRILEDIVDLGAFEQYSSPTINPLIQSVSNTGASDGSISIDSVYGGTPPYQYLWNTGAIESSISNLPTGTYTVTITDSIGCELVQSIDVDLFTSLEELANREASILIFPNPAVDQISVEVNSKQHGLIKLALYDVWGRLVRIQEGGMRQNFELDALSNGVYFIKFTLPNKNITTKRLVIQR